jgi:CheY-like chemotaxis protein
MATNAVSIVPGTEYPPDALQGIRILVVDDEPAVIESTVALLEVLGCLVDSADSTESAVAKARLQQPDIVLVDFRLRELDSGLDTIGRLQELYPGLPVILISGDTAPDRLQQASKAGIPLLSKPAVKDELCAAIASALQDTPGK